MVWEAKEAVEAGDDRARWHGVGPDLLGRRWGRYENDFRRDTEAILAGSKASPEITIMRTALSVLHRLPLHDTSRLVMPFHAPHRPLLASTRPPHPVLLHHVTHPSPTTAPASPPLAPPASASPAAETPGGGRSPAPPQLRISAPLETCATSAGLRDLVRARQAPAVSAGQLGR